MQEIKLLVSDENLDTLLVILNNLKEGLIIDIESQKSLKRSPSQYKPKVATIIREEESGTNDSSGKYATAATYKARLKSTKR